MLSQRFLETLERLWDRFLGRVKSFGDLVNDSKDYSGLENPVKVIDLLPVV